MYMEFKQLKDILTTYYWNNQWNLYQKENWEWVLDWQDSTDIPSEEHLNSLIESSIIAKKKQENISNIKKEISDTIIDFKWGKFKIRKKDFAPIIAQFMDVKENSIVPINVLDMDYTPIPFIYKDFLDFKALVSNKQVDIIKKYS